MSLQPTDVSLTTTLFSAFVPKIIQQSLDQSTPIEPTQHQLYTVLASINISGFTHLCKTLCQMDQKGIRLLGTIINDYYGTLNKIIQAYHGDIINFNGDTVIATWTHGSKDTSPKDNLTKDVLILRATRCAIKLQQQLGSFDIKIKPADRTLRLKIVISSGTFSSMLIGGVQSRMEHVMSGPPIRQLTPLKKLVQPGEILLTVHSFSEAPNETIAVTPVVDAHIQSMYNFKKSHDLPIEPVQTIPKKSTPIGTPKKRFSKILSCCITSKKSNQTATTKPKNDFSNFQPPRSKKSFHTIHYNATNKQHQLSDRTILPKYTVAVKILYINPNAKSIDNSPDNTSNCNTSWNSNHPKHSMAYLNNLKMFIPIPVKNQLQEFHQLFKRGLDQDSYTFIENQLVQMKRICKQLKKISLNFPFFFSYLLH